MTDKVSLKLRAAAAVVDVSVDTLKAAIHTGALKAKRSATDADGNPAGHYLVSPAALDEWFSSLEDA